MMKRIQIGRMLRKRSSMAAILMALSSLVFCLFAGNRIFGQSTDPHFVLLADAYLSKQLNLPKTPPHRNDWASYHEIQLRDGRTERGIYRTSGAGGSAREFRTLGGPIILVHPSDIVGSKIRYFVSFPPFPALLMLPFVALFGIGFNDVLFTAILAGINVGLVFLVLRKLTDVGLSDRTPQEDILLSTVFGFGTVHFWVSVMGQVWFTALVAGVGLTSLYVLATLSNRPFWAGLALGCAMATRPHLAFAAVFFGLPILLPGGKPTLINLKRRFRQLALFSAPILVIGFALMLHNHLRFENPFEFGHTYLASGSIPRIKDYGLFSTHFFTRNLWAAFTLIPTFQSTSPYIQFSKHGMSILLTTPVFIFLLWPRKSPPHAHLRLLLTVAILAIPQLFYQNTGYEQYGYRFSLDYTVYLFMLLAIGGHKIRHPLFLSLAIWGMLVNGVGAIIFKRLPQFFIP